MNRLYTRDIQSLTASDKKSLAFLSYMKIRSTSSGRSGLFSLKQASETLSLSDTTTRKHISRLLDYGYIICVQTNQYRIVSMLDVVGNNCHENFVKISNEQLFSYTWRNISEFRSFLVELDINRNRVHRKASRKGFAVFNQKDKIREKIKNQSNKAFDSLVSASYVEKMTGKCQKTIYSYRAKQKVAVYSKKKVIKLNLTVDDADKVLVSLKGKGKVLHDKLTGSVIFIPISERKVISASLGLFRVSRT